MLTGLGSVQKTALGDAEVCGAWLDGRVALSHSCFAATNVSPPGALVTGSRWPGSDVSSRYARRKLYFRSAGQARRRYRTAVPTVNRSGPAALPERHLSQLNLARAIPYQTASTTTSANILTLLIQLQRAHVS